MPITGRYLALRREKRDIGIRGLGDPMSRARQTTKAEKHRLILAKGLFLHGCSHAKATDEVSRMVSIHQFDNAVEMVLKTVASGRGITPKGKFFYFEELLDKIRDLPLKDKVENLHIQRNIIQHEGDIPSSETVLKYESYTRDFLAAITEKEFGFSFDRLSRASMIEDSKLRELVESAQSSFDTGTTDSYVKCIRRCDQTLTEAKHRVAVVGRDRGYLTYFFSPSHLGRFRGSYSRFQNITAGIDRIPPEKLKEQAEFSIQLVTDLILKWQEEGAIREARGTR
jgi:hypothetical protein